MNTSSLAGHAVELVDKIVKADLPADRIISDFYKQRKYLGSHDRRWITDRVYGIIRNFILLRKMDEESASDSKALNYFLLHEILIADLVPDEIRTNYSQLLESYKMSGNLIDVEKLSASSTQKLRELKSVNNEFILNSFPDFFRDLLASSVKEECLPIMKALNHEAHVCVRVDTSKISRDDVMDLFKKGGVAVSPTSFSPLGIYLPKRINLNNNELYKNGMIEIQEEASQLVGLIVDPHKDEIMVDACAGGGGKSLELAALSGGLSKIYAFDINKERLDNLRTRISRSGYSNVSSRFIADEKFEGIEEFLNAADKVVVDAPCSGSGTIRRNPDKKFKLTKSLVEQHSNYQKRLLKHYSRLVKVGGLLFYVTCSIFEEENQSVVRSFVDMNPGFQIVDVSQLLNEPKFSNLIEDGFLSIYPHISQMDGFFVAMMKRVA